MSQSFKLFRLQQIDTQLDATQLRLDEIELILNDNQSVNEAQIGLETAKDILNHARIDLRRAEGNVQTQTLKIEQTEASLYSGKVQNPKELQDLQNESAALKRYLVVLEERLLEAMLVEEGAQEAARLAENNLAQVKSQVGGQHHQLTDEREILQKDMLRLSGEREAALKTIPAEDLNLYSRLRTQRGGIAVAKVSDKSCSACGSTLSTSLLYAARSPNQINCCDLCGRILYAG